VFLILTLDLDFKIMKKLIFVLIIIFSSYGLLFAQTIGNNAEGASSDIPNVTMSAIRVQCAQSMTATSMYVKIATSGSGYIKCSIYSDSSGNPGIFLMGTNELTNPGTGWKSFTFTSGLSLTSETYYYLVLWTNSTGYAINYTSGGTTPWKDQTYGTWPTSFGTPDGPGAGHAYMLQAVLTRQLRPSRKVLTGLWAHQLHLVLRQPERALRTNGKKAG
jgi:hypothetical protein